MTTSNEDRARDLASRLNLSGKPDSELDEMEIEAALAAADLRGRVEGLTEARDIAGTMAERPYDTEPEFSAVLSVEAAISARLASLQPEVAKREEGR